MKNRIILVIAIYSLMSNICLADTLSLVNSFLTGARLAGNADSKVILRGRVTFTGHNKNKFEDNEVFFLFNGEIVDKTKLSPYGYFQFVRKLENGKYILEIRNKGSVCKKEFLWPASKKFIDVRCSY